MPSKDMTKEMVQKMKEIAYEAHKGQKREHSGEDYIEHPRRIAERFEPDDVAVKHDLVDDIYLRQAVAWGHDLFEDTDVTAEDLRAAGIPEEVIFGIDLLTRKEGESYYDFIVRIAEVDESHQYWFHYRWVKQADIEDNMRDLPEHMWMMRDRYQFARHVLIHG